MNQMREGLLVSDDVIYSILNTGDFECGRVFLDNYPNSLASFRRLNSFLVAIGVVPKYSIILVERFALKQGGRSGTFYRNRLKSFRRSTMRMVNSLRLRDVPTYVTMTADIAAARFIRSQ